MKRIIFILLCIFGFAMNAWATTSYGRFQHYIDGNDIDAPLLKASGAPIQPNEIATLYGTQDGMSVYDDGADVCSWE